MLRRSSDIEIVGEAGDGKDAVALAQSLRPDVLLMDIRMPKLDGLAALDIVRHRYPKVKVIIVSEQTDHEHIEAALRRGAAGYVIKSVNPADLASVIRQTCDETVFHALMHQIHGRVAARDAGLTERESAVLSGIARGLTNRDLAREFWVTEQTVKFHLSNVYRKLKVANRTEASRVAYQLGIVDSPLLDAVAS